MYLKNCVVQFSLCIKKNTYSMNKTKNRKENENTHTHRYIYTLV